MITPKQVVEVVRDAAGELPQRLHLFRLAQHLLGAQALCGLALQLAQRCLELNAGRAQFRLGAFALRDLMFLVPVELGKFSDPFLEVVRHLIE